MAARPIGSAPGPSAQRLADRDGGEGGAPDPAQMAVQAYGKFHNFVHDEEAPWRVNIIGLVAGVLVILNGFFELINVYNAMGEPIAYLVNFYQVFFGIVTVILELKPEYAGGVHAALKNIQDFIHEWALGLQLYWGKAAFYILQGLLTLLSSGFFSFGSAVGAFMTLVGVVNLQLFWKHGKNAPGAATPEDYIRLGA